MRIVRASFGAIVGYMIFALTAVWLGSLSGRNLHAAQPVWFIALTAVYGMVFAGIGGVVADRLAPYRGWAVTGMTALLVLGAAGSLVASPAADARWSQWCALLLMAPCAYLVPRQTAVCVDPNKRSLPMLLAVALFGLVVPNGLFIYWLVHDFDGFGSILQNRLALSFILDVFLALIILSVYFARHPIGRVKWHVFVVLSLLGGFGFSLPLYYWLNRRMPQTA